MLTFVSGVLLQLKSLLRPFTIGRNYCQIHGIIFAVCCHICNTDEPVKFRCYGL
jgi:hypothetical protein